MGINTISLHAPNGINVQKARSQFASTDDVVLPALVGSVPAEKGKSKAVRCESKRTSPELLISMGFQNEIHQLHRDASDRWEPI